MLKKRGSSASKCEWANMKDDKTYFYFLIMCNFSEAEKLEQKVIYVK